MNGQNWKSAYADLLEEHPLLTRVHHFEGSLEATIAELEGEGFDLLVVLHRNIRSAIIKIRLGIRAETYSKDRWPVLLHTKWKIAPPTEGAYSGAVCARLEAAGM